MRLDRAAGRKGGGEEIEHDRPLLQRLLQGKAERLAALRGAPREIGCLRPLLERRDALRCDNCERPGATSRQDRKSVESGKSGAGSLDAEGRSIIKKKT